MRTTPFWQPGDPIALRGVWHQKLWWAMPVTVVQDTPNLIALYWPAGSTDRSPRKRLTPRDMVSIIVSMEKLELVDRVWVETDVLMLTAPGAAHAVYAMWEEGHTRFRCWYVDLMDPLQRTSLGFDTRDHLLDIVISPDRSEWQWKDEEELAEAEAVGLFTPEETHAIRAEGEQVIELMKNNQVPFCDGWEKWVPPPTWKIPDLPTNWDDITGHRSADKR